MRVVLGALTKVASWKETKNIYKILLQVIIVVIIVVVL